MKVSEMNERQKKALYNIKYAANYLLGGLEIDLVGYPEDSEEYKSAKALLDDHDKLVKVLYQWATSEVYSDGALWFGDSAQKFIRDINFCGKEWLMERCDARIRKEGY